MNATKLQFDEQSLRRPDFRGGEPIPLEGGNVFFFPKPCVAYRPKLGGAMVGSRPVTDLGPEFEAALDELDGFARGRGPDEPATTRDFVDALMRLAVAMIRLNYTVSDEQLADLLAYRVGDEASEATWLAIVDVARGNGSK